MLKIDPHIILPCLSLLFGTAGLGTTSIYALALPGLSFIGGAEPLITAVCAETSGCISNFARRDERLQGSPGVQIVFVVSAKLTEHGKSALTSVVVQNTRRPSAVVVTFEPTRLKTTATKPLKVGAQSAKVNK